MKSDDQTTTVGEPLITVAEREVRIAFNRIWEGQRHPSAAFVRDIAERVIAEGSTEANRKIVAVVELAARESYTARIVRAYRDTFGAEPDASFVEHAAARLREEEGRTS